MDHTSSHLKRHKNQCLLGLQVSKKGQHSFPTQIIHGHYYLSPKGSLQRVHHISGVPRLKPKGSILPPTLKPYTTSIKGGRVGGSRIGLSTFFYPGSINSRGSVVQSCFGFFFFELLTCLRSHFGQIFCYSQPSNITRVLHICIAKPLSILLLP